MGVGEDVGGGEGSALCDFLEGIVRLRNNGEKIVFRARFGNGRGDGDAQRRIVGLCIQGGHAVTFELSETGRRQRDLEYASYIFKLH